MQTLSDTIEHLLHVPHQFGKIQSSSMQLSMSSFKGLRSLHAESVIFRSMINCSIFFYSLTYLSYQYALKPCRQSLMCEAAEQTRKLKMHPCKSKETDRPIL